VGSLVSLFLLMVVWGIQGMRREEWIGIERVGSRRSGRERKWRIREKAKWAEEKMP